MTCGVTIIRGRARSALPAPASAARARSPGRAPLLFVASLGYFLFVYRDVRHPGPRSGASGAALAWNVAALHASSRCTTACSRASASERWVARTVPAASSARVYVWVASLLFIAVCALWQPVPGVAWQRPGCAAPWRCAPLQVAGVVADALAARAVIDVLRAGRHPAAASAAAAADASSRPTGPTAGCATRSTSAGS